MYRLVSNAGILEQSMGARNRAGTELAGRYDNFSPARFLASIDCSKIPAQNKVRTSDHVGTRKTLQGPSEDHIGTILTSSGPPTRELGRDSGIDQVATR